MRKVIVGQPVNQGQVVPMVSTKESTAKVLQNVGNEILEAKIARLKTEALMCQMALTTCKTDEQRAALKKALDEASKILEAAVSVTV